ncbi:hypothetical protein GCM10010431_72310 [Streptomyces kunmingensis]
MRDLVRQRNACSPGRRGCEHAAQLARKAGDRTVERLALQHLAGPRVDAGQWHQALTTADQTLAFDDRPDSADIPASCCSS